MTMFIVLSSWPSHCESSLSSRDEYSTVPSLMDLAVMFMVTLNNESD